MPFRYKNYRGQNIGKPFAKRNKGDFVKAKVLGNESYRSLDRTLEWLFKADWEGTQGRFCEHPLLIGDGIRNGSDEQSRGRELGKMTSLGKGQIL